MKKTKKTKQNKTKRKKSKRGGNWNRLLNNRIAFPSSRRVVIGQYRLIIHIFSAVICRYEMMRLCWFENPLMRPTFAEITKRFQYYLREYEVLSSSFV